MDTKSPPVNRHNLRGRYAIGLTYLAYDPLVLTPNLHQIVQRLVLH